MWGEEALNPLEMDEGLQAGHRRDVAGEETERGISGE